MQDTKNVTGIGNMPIWRSGLSYQQYLRLAQTHFEGRDVDQALLQANEVGDAPPRKLAASTKGKMVTLIKGNADHGVAWLSELGYNEEGDGPKAVDFTAQKLDADDLDNWATLVEANKEELSKHEAKKKKWLSDVKVCKAAVKASAEQYPDAQRIVAKADSSSSSALWDILAALKAFFGNGAAEVRDIDRETRITQKIHSRRCQPTRNRGEGCSC